MADIEKDSNKKTKDYDPFAEGNKLGTKEELEKVKKLNPKLKRKLKDKGVPVGEIKTSNISKKNPSDFDRKFHQGYVKGASDVRDAVNKEGKVSNLKKGGTVKKKKYCKDGCAIRGKTRGKLL